jgi:hypothetical protein
MPNISNCQETLILPTVSTDVTHLQGTTVSFEIAPLSKPKKKNKYVLRGAFTATEYTKALKENQQRSVQD